MDSNVKFIEELYKWHDEKNERFLLPKLKLEHIFVRLNFYNTKTQQPREDFYMQNMYACYILIGLNFNIHLHK